MFDQQLDMFGGRHDLAPAHETVKLFDSAPQLRGQIALDTDAPAPPPADVNSPELVAARRAMFQGFGWTR